MRVVTLGCHSLALSSKLMGDCTKHCWLAGIGYGLVQCTLYVSYLQSQDPTLTPELFWVHTLDRRKQTLTVCLCADGIWGVQNVNWLWIDLSERSSTFCNFNIFFLFKTSSLVFYACKIQMEREASGGLSKCLDGHIHPLIPATELTFAVIIRWQLMCC